MQNKRCGRHFWAQASAKDVTTKSKKHRSLAWICRFKSSGPEKTRKKHIKDERSGENQQAFLLAWLENGFLNGQRRAEKDTLRSQSVEVPRESGLPCSMPAQRAPCVS